MRRISDAIFGDPKRLDRDLWLSRFSDLMLNGIQFPANSPIDLAAWRRAVREGRMRHLHARLLAHLCFWPVRCPGVLGFRRCRRGGASHGRKSSLGRVCGSWSYSYWKDSNPTAIRKAIAERRYLERRRPTASRLSAFRLSIDPSRDDDSSESEASASGRAAGNPGRRRRANSATPTGFRRLAHPRAGDLPPRLEYSRGHIRRSSEFFPTITAARRTARRMKNGSSKSRAVAKARCSSSSFNQSFSRDH